MSDFFVHHLQKNDSLRTECGTGGFVVLCFSLVSSFCSSEHAKWYRNHMNF